MRAAVRGLIPLLRLLEPLACIVVIVIGRLIVACPLHRSEVPIPITQSPVTCDVYRSDLGLDPSTASETPSLGPGYGNNPGVLRADVCE